MVFFGRLHLVVVELDIDSVLVQHRHQYGNTLWVVVPPASVHVWTICEGYCNSTVHVVQAIVLIVGGVGARHNTSSCCDEKIHRNNPTPKKMCTILFFLWVRKLVPCMKTEHAVRSRSMGSGLVVSDACHILYISTGANTGRHGPF
jgi:hypothetical protein